MKKNLLISLVLIVLGASSLVMCGEDDPTPVNNSNNPTNNLTNNSTNNLTIADMGIDADEDLNNSTDTGIDASEDVNNLVLTWEDGIAAIFRAACSRCHSWTLNYDLVVSDIAGLEAQLETGHGKLTADQYEDVVEWLADGAPKN